MFSTLTYWSVFLILVTNIVSLFSMLFIGNFIISSLGIKLGDHKYQNTFNRLAVGLVSIVSFFAILQTSFNSSLLVIPLIGFLFIIKNKGLQIPKISVKQYDFKLIGCLSIIAFTYFLYLLTHFSTNIYLPFMDVIFYGRASEVMLSKGIENTKLYNVFELGNSDASMYHFFELWLTSFYSWIQGAPGLISYYIATMPVLLTIIIIGYLALFENFLKLNLVVIFICCGLVFLTGFPFTHILKQFLSNLPIYAQPEQWSILIFPKLMIVQLMLLWASIYLIKQNLNIAATILLITGCIYPVILPHTALGFCFLMYLKHQSVFKISFVKDLFPVVAVVLFFFVFYGLINKSDDGGGTSTFFLKNTDLVYHIKNLLAELSKRSIHLIFSFVILISLIVQRKYAIINKLKPFVFTTALMISFGWFFSRLLSEHPEGYQFFVILAAPFASIITALSVGFIYKFIIEGSKNYSLKLSVFSLFYLALVVTSIDYYNSIGIFPNYISDGESYSKVRSKIAKGSLNHLSAYFEPANETMFYGEMRATGAELLLFGNYYSTCLTLFDDLKVNSSSYFKYYTLNEVFYRYVKNNNLASDTMNVEMAQKKFLKDMKIDYVFFADGCNKIQYKWLINATTDSIYNPTTKTSVFFIDRNKL